MHMRQVDHTANHFADGRKLVQQQERADEHAAKRQTKESNETARPNRVGNVRLCVCVCMCRP